MDDDDDDDDEKMGAHGHITIQQLFRLLMQREAAGSDEDEGGPGEEE